MHTDAHKDQKNVMQVLTISKYDMHSATIKQDLSGHCPDRHHCPTAYAREIRDATGAHVSIQGVCHANCVCTSDLKTTWRGLLQLHAPCTKHAALNPAAES